MSMLFLNENTNGVLKWNQREAERSHMWFTSVVHSTDAGWALLFSPGQKQRNVKHYSRKPPDV